MRGRQRGRREATNDIDGDGVGEIRDCGQQIKQREILEDLHTLENQLQERVGG